MTETEMSTLVASIEHRAGSSQDSQARTRNKRPSCQQERCKTVSICGCCSRVYRNLKEPAKIKTTGTNKQVQGNCSYGVKIQNKLYFYTTGDERNQNEIKKTIPFAIESKE